MVSSSNWTLWSQGAPVWPLTSSLVFSHPLSGILELPESPSLDRRRRGKCSQFFVFRLLGGVPVPHSAARQNAKLHLVPNVVAYPADTPTGDLHRPTSKLQIKQRLRVTPDTSSEDLGLPTLKTDTLSSFHFCFQVELHWPPSKSI